jgi:uncharacterized hydrophobic protein (TIGR00271 family)
MTLLRLDIHADPVHADAAVDALLAHPNAINVTRIAGARLQPPGDLVSCDVPREAAGGVLEGLEAIGCCHGSASVTVHTGLAHISERANAAEAGAAGEAADALIWPLVRDTLEEEVELSITFVAFMVLATMLGAIGVVFNSAILVIGAMVLGPEFGPLASLCVGLVRGDGVTVRRAAATLVIGFALAVIGAWLFTLAMRSVGVFPDQLDFSGLIEEVAHPGWISLVIALIAGVAGMLTLTSSRSGALIGVLISVTTIPAAAASSVLASYDRWGDATHAGLTLLVNLAGIGVASIATLAVHARVTRRRGDPSLRR